MSGKTLLGTPFQRQQTPVELKGAKACVCPTNVWARACAAFGSEHCRSQQLKQVLPRDAFVVSNKSQRGGSGQHVELVGSSLEGKDGTRLPKGSMFNTGCTPLLPF